ncbi:MAG: hypothetical protein IPP34_04075 [Bacteroidetes bacterium]|nr:hypothetical protein [Bacteroidota bacterium]
MDFTHLHLILNHFPIIGTIIAVFILIYGIYKSYLPIQKVSLALIVVLAIIAIPVFLTGEPAEEAVENLPGVSELVIEAHEEAAEASIWVMEFTGILAFIAFLLIAGKKQFATTSVYLVVLAGLLSFVMMARTGYLGGQIRHTELNGSVVQTSAESVSGSDKEEDD